MHHTNIRVLKYMLIIGLNSTGQVSFLPTKAPFIKHINLKIYIKVSYSRSYMFRSIRTVLKEFTLSLAKVTFL
jgi:hypothetical protein